MNAKGFDRLEAARKLLNCTGSELHDYLESLKTEVLTDEDETMLLQLLCANPFDRSWATEFLKGLDKNSCQGVLQ